MKGSIKWGFPQLHLQCKRATRENKLSARSPDSHPISPERACFAVNCVFLLRCSDSYFIEVVFGQCTPHSSLLFESSGSWNRPVSARSVFTERGLHLRVIVRLVSVVVFDVSTGLFHRILVRSCKFLLGFFENILVSSSKGFPPVMSVCHGCNSSALKYWIIKVN